MLGITFDFGIVSVVKDAEKKEIKIHEPFAKAIS